MNIFLEWMQIAFQKVVPIHTFLVSDCFIVSLSIWVLFCYKNQVVTVGPSSLMPQPLIYLKLENVAANFSMKQSPRKSHKFYQNFYSISVTSHFI